MSKCTPIVSFKRTEALSRFLRHAQLPLQLVPRQKGDTAIREGDVELPPRGLSNGRLPGRIDGAVRTRECFLTRPAAITPRHPMYGPGRTAQALRPSEFRRALAHHAPAQRYRVVWALCQKTPLKS
jgi:hypothetical protein